MTSIDSTETPAQSHWLARMCGTRENFRESFQVAVVMLVVAGIYQYLSIRITGYPLHLGEFIGTWTGLTCVWLYRTENIHSWPFGIVSVLALGWFFGDIGLPGQQWLNWGFFMAISLWGWPNWVLGGQQDDDLPVTTMSWPQRFAAIAAIAIGTYVVFTVIEEFSPGTKYPILDALVVASSVMAQFLLGAKKVESWWLWFGPVNVVSIALFTMAGAYTLTTLYVAFLIHAGFAINSWNKARV